MRTLMTVSHDLLVPASTVDASELQRRMSRPQRHRLLHGYPLAAAVPRIADADRIDSILPSYHPEKGLLVGVLPHPYCNPAVAGCGFCTFPHELFNARKATRVIEHVADEIRHRTEARPELTGRRVDALYIGGGTANLSPAGPFRELCRTLASRFDLSHAEVTLEGVPAAFLNRKPLLVDILREELPARHFRISMGIQTFDVEQLRRMGRLGFGDGDTFREVVQLGHARGFTVSGDFLFNLPGQSPGAMRDDLRRAAEIGLDHLGLYQLVLFRGLGTTWSQDPAMIAALPARDAAIENWLSLKELLEGLGFDQTTLTNFERRSLRDAPRRFLYEECSYHPEFHEMVGFGPSAISVAGDDASAVKAINPDGADAYIEAVDRGAATWDRAFVYTRRDLRVFHLTRRLAALEIDRQIYRDTFGTDPLADFPREFAALEAEGLIETSEDAIRPTPRGMFYSDSIAGLLAWRRLAEKDRAFPDQPKTCDLRRNDNGHGHM